MKVNFSEFIKRFCNEYDFLYKNHDRVAGFDEAVAMFDKYLEKDIGGFKAFVSEYAQRIGDVVSSDREAAAFMFALESMGALEEADVEEMEKEMEEDWDDGGNPFLPEYLDRDERDYGPSNPWDAPGMKISDFLPGVIIY